MVTHIAACLSMPLIILTNDNPVDSHAQPVPLERYGSEEPLSPSTLVALDSMEQIAKLKAKLEGAELTEGSLIQQIHSLFEHLQKKDKEISQV